MVIFACSLTPGPVVKGEVVERDQRLLALVRQNFLVGIASLGALNESNNTRCGQELEMLLRASVDREVWALKGVFRFQ